MAYVLTEKLRELVPYDPIQGEYSIRLDANESYLNLDGALKEAVLDAVSKVPFNRYPDPLCTGVRKAFADYYGLDPACVTAGNGSDELISILVNCFFKKGDKLLTVSPDFSMYRFYASLAELENVVVEKDPSLELDMDQVIRQMKEQGAAGILLSNPCNPTSRGLDEDEMLRLIRSADEMGALVILDEAYMDFWEKSLLNRVQEFGNLIILRTCSKAIGLASLRLGFAVACETITRALQAAKSPYNVNALTQAAAEVVLRDKAYLAACVQKLIAARETLYARLVKLKETHSALGRIWKPVTNFVFLSTSGNREVYEKLLSKGIAIRYMGQYLRITAGSPEENTAVIAALDEIFHELEGGACHEGN